MNLLLMKTQLKTLQILLMTYLLMQVIRKISCQLKIQPLIQPFQNQLMNLQILSLQMMQMMF